MGCKWASETSTMHCPGGILVACVQPCAEANSLMSLLQWANVVPRLR